MLDLNHPHPHPFTLVPPGPVSDRTRVELRLALRNESETPRSFTVDFFLDRHEPEQLLERQEVVAPPGRSALARAWWDTTGQAGDHSLLYRVQAGDWVEEGGQPLEVMGSDSVGLPVFQGVWVETMAPLLLHPQMEAAERERRLRADVDAMARLGMRLIIVGYVEYGGVFFYPSGIEFFDGDVGRMSRGADCPFDVVGIILDQADRHGLHVMLGLGRGGDTYLLWEFEKEGWAERNQKAVALAQRIAHELWDRYHRHPSLYGWYLTHEMGDLEKASAYYNPVADYCHALAPGKPVLIAPADTRAMPRETLAGSSVDIFAYQDGVGTGYVPYRYTYDPENRIVMLDEVFARYRGWHEGTDKHIWSDLEIWEMDGSQGYGGAYPASFERVQRQIEIERKYAPVLTAYAWHGYMHDPAAGDGIDERAVKLWRAYRAHYQAFRQQAGR